jgi:hypothetical protein
MQERHRLSQRPLQRSQVANANAAGSPAQEQAKTRRRDPAARAAANRNAVVVVVAEEANEPRLGFVSWVLSPPSVVLKPASSRAALTNYSQIKSSSSSSSSSSKQDLVGAVQGRMESIAEQSVWSWDLQMHNLSRP